MGNVSLTKLLFAGLIITFVAASLFSAYATFAVVNNASIDPQYRSIFEDIAGQYSEFNNTAMVVKDKGLVTNIFNAGAAVISGSLNVFVTGLQAIGTFFDMIPIFGNILNALSFGLPGLGGLIGLATLIFGIYVAMRYIQSVSNKFDLP